MPQVRCARGSGFRSRPLVTEVVDSVPSGPSKVAVSSIALARKEEECRPFSREHVELHLKDRGATFFDFCCREAVGSMPEMPTALPAPKGFLQVPQRPPSTRTTTASPAIRSRHPSRPPSSRASQVSRGESPTSPRSVDIIIKQKHASFARRARMHELQRGMIDHDEERLGDLARGTSPLLGARGQAMLPVPPLEVDPLRMPLDLRLRLAVGNKTRKSFRRPWLMAVHSSIEEARDMPIQPAVVEAFEDVRTFDVAHPRPEGPLPQHEYELPRRLQSPKDLLLRAEELIEAKALEDQCMPIAWRFLATAYDATPPQVLVMLRHVKAFAMAQPGFTMASKRELLQIADELLHTLTTRLKDATADFLAEVTETMTQCEVGSAAFSDLVKLMAQRSKAPEI